MFRKLLISGAAVASLGLAGGQAAYAQTACTFADGFAAIASAMPATVGACAGDPYSTTPGQVYQNTTAGTLSWSNTDNIPKFTDAFATWSLLPGGIQVAPPDPSVPLQTGRSNVAGVTIGGPAGQSCVPTVLSKGHPVGNVVLQFSLQQPSCYTIAVNG